MSRRIAQAREALPAFYVPTGLSTELRLLLLDPRTGKTRWGAYQVLMQRLVTEWIEKQRLMASGGGVALEADQLRNLGARAASLPRPRPSMDGDNPGRSTPVTPPPVIPKP